MRIPDAVPFLLLLAGVGRSFALGILAILLLLPSRKRLPLHSSSVNVAVA